ncbi:MAG: flippase [Candidatus Brocadia sp.]|jgi:O-antigen/teichoic acid export membrane protein
MASESISKDSEKDIKKVAKGAGITLVGSIIGRLFLLVSQVIIARFFDKEVFGLYILGFTVLRLTELIARLGLSNGAMRFISMYRKEDRGRVKGILITAPLISFLNGILIGCPIYLFAGFIATTFFRNPAVTGSIKMFSLCTPFMAAMGVVAMSSRGFHTTKYSVYIKDIIQPGVNIACVMIFIWLGFGIYWVINAFVISHVVALAAGIFFLSRQFSAIKERAVKPVYEIKKLIHYSAPLLFTGFISFLIQWTAVIMLGFMNTPAEVAIYRAASQIPVFLVLILSASGAIYAPAVAELHYLGQRERMERIFKTTTRWVFVLTLPISLILVFSSREVMALFGSGYIEDGASVLIILAIAQFINCVTGGVAFTLSMTGKQHLEMINTFATLFLSIVLNYLLIPKYGSFGAAVATGVSLSVMNLIRLLEVYLIYKMHPYNRNYIQGMVSGTVAVVVLYLMDAYFLIDEYLLINNFLLNHALLVKLVANILIVLVIFAVGFVLKGISDEDRFIFHAITKKVGLTKRASHV